MDSFELNKIAGAVLAALLVIFGGKELIYIAEGGHSKDTKKAGYTLPVRSCICLNLRSSPGSQEGLRIRDCCCSVASG